MFVAVCVLLWVLFVVCFVQDGAAPRQLWVSALYLCSIIPLVYTFRPRKGLWKLLGKTPLVDLNVGEPIFRDQDLPKPEAIKKLQAEAYHIMQVMAGVHPGDPTYCADLNPENYQKTM